MLHDARRCVVAPYVLEQIASNGTPAQREWALSVLRRDAVVRSQRGKVHAAIADTRGLARPEVAAGGQPHRTIFDCHHSDSDPPQGTSVRAEGASATGDEATDEAYDGLGATYDFYWSVFRRNSIDAAGMPLKAYVHYGQAYPNAFWDGAEMIFGDGDNQFLGLTTKSVDVIGHELTHGVTAHEANLDYNAQSGALNESISDVFGSLVKQRTLDQSAGQADWLIGEGLLAASVHGEALRSMKAPGTAYDDPVIGKDPQPATMAHYLQTTEDNGGVHTNSGIPNHAFYLAAVAIGGFAWEKAGRIWYETLSSPELPHDADFARFATLTHATATRLFGESGPAEAVAAAWSQVGVHVASRV